MDWTLDHSTLSKCVNIVPDHRIIPNKMNTSTEGVALPYPFMMKFKRISDAMEFHSCLEAFDF